MKALPQFTKSKCVILRKVQKNCLCLMLYLFISNLVAMTTVKISFAFFLHATECSTKFENISYSNNKDMVDFL